MNKIPEKSNLLKIGVSLFRNGNYLILALVLPLLNFFFILVTLRADWSRRRNLAQGAGST